MTDYTLITTRPTGGRSTYVFDYPADAQIIADARQALGEAVVSIAVGRGTYASDMEWLGSWKLRGGQPQWTDSNIAPFPPGGRDKPAALAQI